MTSGQTWFRPAVANMRGYGRAGLRLRSVSVFSVSETARDQLTLELANGGGA